MFWSSLSSIFICKLVNLTTRCFSFDLGIIANGMELGPMTSPNLLTATPLSLAGGSLAITDGVDSFAGSIRDCLVWLPTSIGIIWTKFGCELREAELRRALGDVLSVSKSKFAFKLSFSSTGLNSDPNPPGLATRPQHEQRR